MTATTVTRSSNRKIRVAIIGVGNCASSLVQGVEYYKNASTGELIPGLMHIDLGGYHTSGSLIAPSSCFMKSPPVQYHDDIAREKAEEVIRETALRESGLEADVPVVTPAD